MMKLALTSIFSILIILSGKTQDVEWLISGGFDRSDKGQCIAIDDDGYSYVSGFYNEQATFGPFNIPFINPSSKEVFVAKVDPDGNYVWVKYGDNYYDDRGLGICLDSQKNVYVTGTCWGDIFFDGISTPNNTWTDEIYITKFDNNGVVQWVKHAGSADGDDHAHSIVCDPNDNIYITGFVSSYSGTSTANFDAITIPCDADSTCFIAKMDVNGNYDWVVEYGGEDGERDNRIAVDADNNVYVCGGFRGTRTFGSTVLQSTGGKDIYVAKFDPQGNFIFASRAGGNYSDRANDLICDQYNNVYVTGEFRDICQFGSFTIDNKGGPKGRDIFVAKLSETGEWEWATRAGSKKGSDKGMGIDVNSTGNIVVSGQYSSKADFGPFEVDSDGDSVQLFLAGIDTLGEWRWIKEGGGPGYDRATAVAIDEDCNIYATGYYQNTMTFDSESSTVLGLKDIYTTKLSDVCFGYVEEPTEPEIIEEKCTLLANNVITPNGDGKNDEIFLGTDCTVEFKAIIMNRWGNIVFESNDINEGWGGKDQKGNDLSDGTYFYKSSYVFSDGTGEEKTGFITIVRPN